MCRPVQHWSEEVPADTSGAWVALVGPTLPRWSATSHRSLQRFCGPLVQQVAHTAGGIALRGSDATRLLPPLQPYRTDSSPLGLVDQVDIGLSTSRGFCSACSEAIEAFCPLSETPLESVASRSSSPLSSVSVFHSKQQSRNGGESRSRRSVSEMPARQNTLRWNWPISGPVC